MLPDALLSIAAQVKLMLTISQPKLFQRVERKTTFHRGECRAKSRKLTLISISKLNLFVERGADS